MANELLAGEHEAAYRIARAVNPFASSCGHGCHAPCESSCRRRYFGAPVSIARIEAFSAGYSPPALPNYPRRGACTSAHDVRSVAGLVGLDPEAALAAPRSGKRVAIVGAGVTRLACAHDLYLLGHDCVVFESAHEPGGVLSNVIPGFRFPVNSARAESAAILAMGITFEGGYRVAGSGDLRAFLSGEFDAVFLAVGASEAWEPPFPGQRTHPQVTDAVDLLVDTSVPAGATVVVGEGVLAVDAARSIVRRAVRDGLTSVSVQLVLREEGALTTTAPEMLAAAVEEGIILHFGWERQRFLEGSSGAVKALEVVRPADRSAMVIPCDNIVSAGRRGANALAFWPDVATGADGLVAVDPETLQTSMYGVWAGGACAFGHRSIAHATADGKRAAWQIHAVLTGRPVTTSTASAWVELDSWSAARAPRALATQRGAPPAGSLPPSDPFGGPLPPVDPFAGSPSSTGEGVTREAARCFDCSVLPHVDESCTNCGKCVKVCEPGALTLAAGPPAALTLDQDVCTRCGLCVHACPEGSIAMVRLV
ncbi:MAG TPA: FAD-dependent oxidoreductase, partial [Gemmatimonadaceae bacterium]